MTYLFDVGGGVLLGVDLGTDGASAGAGPARRLLLRRHVVIALVTRWRVRLGLLLLLLLLRRALLRLFLQQQENFVLCLLLQ